MTLQHFRAQATREVSTWPDPRDCRRMLFMPKHFILRNHQRVKIVLLLQGLPGVSLQWGAWGGLGMAAQEGPLLARLARLGMGAIQPVQGLTTLQRCLQGINRDITDLVVQALSAGQDWQHGILRLVQEERLAKEISCSSL